MISKIIIALFFCLSYFITFGQEKNTKQNGSSSAIKGDIEYYIDSVRIYINNYYFDIEKIEDIKVVQSYDSLKKPVGKIYMRSKLTAQFNFISLKYIKDIYCKSATLPNIFMVDNSFLKGDLESYKIDSSYILSVETIKGVDIESLKKDNPNLTIIHIKTKNVDNLNDSMKIRLRGNENNL